MNAALWPQVRRLFEEAMSLPPAQREAFVRASEASAEVQAEVLSLLAHSTGGDASASRFLGQSPQLSTDPQDLAPVAETGMRLGAWELLTPLGSGGMGEVWRARRADGAYQGEAAVKLLKRGMDSQAVLQRFAQERQALARLDHPHIARLFDAGLSPSGLPYFVMELVQGQPIDAACADLSLEARLALFLQLADAVAYAHRHLLVHRDLKPGNVLVNQDGQVKLLDFGIAKALDPMEGDGDAEQTQAGQRPYTPNYASPEQVRGEPVSTATDLYSLGVLLYVMLTGVRPYGRHANTPQAAAQSVLLEQPTRPSALSPDDVLQPDWLAQRRRLRGDLDNILLKALQKEVGQRFPSVDAMADDVRAFMDGRPVSAHPPSSFYLAAKFVQRHRIGTALGSVALLAVMGAAGLAWHQARVAQERFTQVRQLANQLVFKYHDQIVTLPGATKVSQALLADAANFMDGLSQAAQSDPTLSQELAGTFYRISKLQGVDKSINTGQHALAQANLDKALELARRYERDPNTSMLALTEAINMHAAQAEVWQRQGQMTRAEAALREALPLLDLALKRDAKDTWALSSAVSVHGIHARILGTQLDVASLGQWQAACASADKSRAAAEATLIADPVNIYVPDTLAFTLSNQAHCKIMAGQWSEAEALVQQQILLRDQMAAKLPEDLDFRYQRALARAQLATVLSLQERHAEALKLMATAENLMQAAVAADPGNDGGQKQLDRLQAQGLALSFRAGDADSTRRAADEWLSRHQASDKTTTPDFARDQARAQVLLWAARAWQTASATRALSSAQEIVALMQPPPSNDDNASRRWLLAQGLTEQARALATLNRTAEARTALKAALSAWDPDEERLVSVPPLLAPQRAQTKALAEHLSAGLTTGKD